MRRSVTAFLAIAALAIASDRVLRSSGLAAHEPAADAAKIAEAWWFVGDGKSRSDESSQKTGAGPKDGSFFAFTGTVHNLGSYSDAWNFYAKKCGAEETWSDSRRIIGKPSKREGYYTIFQRTDGGRNTTTFASHEKDATITVHVHEIEASRDKTVLQLTVVVVRH
jgi:hypothetical protein